MTNNTQPHINKIRLSYIPNGNPLDWPKITCSKDMYELILQRWENDRLHFVEEFKVAYLSRANRVIGIQDLSIGGTTGTLASPKLIFAAAILANAESCILFHNHPSGQLQPSEADKVLTKKCKEAGKILDINVIDHLIVTANGYYSFADEGEL